MRKLIRKHANRLVVIAAAIGVSGLSIGCTVTGGQIGGGGGVGTNGRVTGTIGGTITFKHSQLNDSEVVNEDTGQHFTDDGTLDYSAVTGTEGTDFGGSVFDAGGGSGGGDGGGDCGGHECLIQ